MISSSELEATSGDLCYEYFKKNHEEDFLKIIGTRQVYPFTSLLINFVQLFEELPLVGAALLSSPAETLEQLNVAANRALVHEYLRKQQPGHTEEDIGFQLKVRIQSLPVCEQLHRMEFPSCKEAGSFLCLIGTVIRVGTAKLLEYSKTYECDKCRGKIIVKAIPSRYHVFPRVVECPKMCEKAKLSPIATTSNDEKQRKIHFRDYQEIKLQEQVKNMDFGSMPKAINVILEDDLVNRCRPGDDVAISGSLYLRWKRFKTGAPIESELVCLANFVETNNDKKCGAVMKADIDRSVSAFWRQYAHNPFVGRNIILASFCPQICGMYLVKLAMCMVLAGGVSREVYGTTLRGESHMLLVGDPGTGKSQLLKYASKISPRSVLTTGIGTSSAGLTASAVKDNGEWHLEAGALVLADGGVCCIDEFSCIKEHDRTSIHEAMEQQSISIAKAGMVTKLPTRVTMIAATNPKGKFDKDQPLSTNLGISSPLLSRFDVLMILADTQDDDWDNCIADFILGGKNMFSEAMKISGIDIADMWDAERLQDYFMHIKRLNPKMSNAANLIISYYYQHQRSLDGDRMNSARTTVRLLESLRRLAEGHARLMFRNTVSLYDAIVAIQVMESSMQFSSILSNQNILHSSFPADAFEELTTQTKSILHKLGLLHLLDSDEEQECDALAESVEMAVRSSDVHIELEGCLPGNIHEYGSTSSSSSDDETPSPSKVEIQKRKNIQSTSVDGKNIPKGPNDYYIAPGSTNMSNDSNIQQEVSAAKRCKTDDRN